MTVRKAPIEAVGMFRSNANFYQATGGDSTPDGSTTMTRYLVVAPIREVGTTTNRHEILCGNSAIGVQSGWSMVYDHISERFELYAADGSGAASVSVDVEYHLHNHLYRPIIVGFSYDGTTALGRLSSGVAFNAVAATAGYTAPANPMTFGVEADNEDNPCEDFVIAALLSTDSVARTDAEMATDLAVLVDNLSNSRDLRTGLTPAMEHYWDAADIITAPGIAALNWTDRIASEVVVRNGSPQGYGLASIF